MPYNKILKILGIIFILFKTNLVFALKIFLFCNMQNFHHINAGLEIENIVFKDELNNYPIKLVQNRIEFNKNFGQVYLGFVDVPKKELELVINFKKAFKDDREIKIESKYKRIIFPVNLIDQKKGKIILFLNWDVRGSFRKSEFIPALSISFEVKPKMYQILLVLDKENEGLWMIDESFNRVVYFMEIKGEPWYLVSNFNKSEVYILCKKDKTLKILNPRTLSIEKVFSVAPLQHPEFMAVDELRKGVIISPSDRKIALIEVSNGNIINLKYTSFEPGYIYYTSRKYFIASNSDNSIYVYDNNLNFIKRLEIPFSPVGIFSDGEKLYVSDRMGNISVFNLHTLFFEGKIGHLCSFVWRGAFVRNKVYLACEDEIITYFYKHQISQNFTIEGIAPFYEFAYSPSKEWLYVSSYKEKLIAVIDIFNDKIKGYINLGGPAYEMVSIF